jgi:cellobiose phosphorylase
MINPKINQSLFRLKIQLSDNFLAKEFACGEPPMRSELFSADQMEQHGKTLANSHILNLHPKPEQQLLISLAENEVLLFEVHNMLTETVNANKQITPAGEWLLDNFYLIEEQIRTAKRHLPKSYNRELPRLSNGPSKNLPRVYDLAQEIISHGDGRVDPENLIRFIAAYQTIKDLKLGELWAVPTMLRLALIENLRRVAVRVAAGRIERDLADSWADQMISVAGKDPKNLILIMADMARSDPPMTTPFVSEFTRKLQDLSPALISPLSWIEQHLSESGLTIEKLIQSGNQQQAADQVSISNSIGSLRFLESMDWRKFVEKMSTVEQILYTDPAGVYGKMDFITRDSYRHVIEKIAKKSDLSESEIAQKAISLTLEGDAKNGKKDRTSHVGFYLIDKGVNQLEALVKVRFSFSAFQRKVKSRIPLLIYISPILLLTAVFTACLLSKAYAGGLHGQQLWIICFLFLLCSSQLAVELVNWISTMLAKPQPLPRMDFSDGIPPEFSTLVVIPAMLINEQNIKELVESLEVRFLANRDRNLHFSLLTDFQDSDKETLKEDAPLVSLVVDEIKKLNEKYNNSNSGSFFLFHRPRQWNPRERLWMGYERKRGKLEELNSMLLSGSKIRFSQIIGKSEILSSIKYIITLDIDTQLPRDSAYPLVGAMAHPLNHVCYDEEKKSVSAGYTILQPRIAVSLPGTNRSHYARLYGSQSGIDPYTRTVSDVYQDVFGEGSYIGKGIYDVNVFVRALNGRFPENKILSHDLIEGCHTRAGLLSDVQLYEEYPSTYNTDVNRRHRWIRGDWQLIGWLLPFVSSQSGSLQRNPLSGLSRWKIFDNLRRSLIPLSLILMFLFGWLVLSQAWFWTLAAIGIILIPSVAISILDVFKKPVDMHLHQHLAFILGSAAMYLAQALFTLITLPYEAYYSMDAIIRTLWRLMISHKKLLEWNPSNIIGRINRLSLFNSYRRMWISPAIVISIIIYCEYINLAFPIVAIPILFLWVLSPTVTWWLSLPVERPIPRLSVDQKLFLHNLSRKTWSFFETFVGPVDNWLPPDNFQEFPGGEVAHRTSPTNIGLALLANLSAYDFGYISAGILIDRTSKAFQSMESLERFKGHFFNWYDTQSLLPLRPFYISSVDSGNLAGFLLTLRQGLLALPDVKIISNQLFEGINDTFRILLDAAEGIDPNLFDQLQIDLDVASKFSSSNLLESWLILQQLTESTSKVREKFIETSEKEVLRWAEAIASQCRNSLDELTFLAPWLILSASDEMKTFFPNDNGILTLRELANLNTKLLPETIHQLLPDIANERFDEFRSLIIIAIERAKERITNIELLAQKAYKLSIMEYDFLYDKARHLLAIGYNVDEKRRDASYYDLLASEARLCCFVAIAQGQIPQESWFALGRLLTSLSGDPILLSWSGSMFEYLMPLLVMPTYENTLLDQTNKTAVKRQIEYGKRKGVPWGISESCYNTVDNHLNFQYRAFGVPGLGLKRGLAEDLVIAPYASALALMVEPEEACSNLQQLSSDGLVGKYGFYEAVDYTASRLKRGQSKAVIKSFMAHHQGMSLLSLAYLILDRPLQKRFESDPLFEATMLLLQERIPKVTNFYLHTSGVSDTLANSNNPELPVRIIDNPDIAIPEVQLLSNGRYNVMITSAGGGYSRWNDIALNRWHEDITCDNWGTFCFIRDLSTGEFWSTSYQPTHKRSKNYEAIFSEGHAEFRRRDQNIDMHTEIVVSPEDDIEMRRIHLINRSRIKRTIDVTSYSEVVLASSVSDALHPAFSNLFVQTEIIPESQAILCNRRPRSAGDHTFWMFHTMAVRGADIKDVSFETDRMKFIGHGNSISSPQALKDLSPLSGSQGSVLDPIVAIRYQIILEPDETVTIDMIFGIGENRSKALLLVDKYQDRHLANRVFELAWTHSSVVLRQINAVEADAQLYGRLANSILFANSFLRAEQGIIIKNHRGQSGLWGYSISGDLPIVLLHIEDPANINLVRQMVQAHAYWRLKGLTVDLVIWNEDHAGYRQLLQEQIMNMIAAGVEANYIDKPGGIFVRQADQISNEDRILIQTVARVIISDKHGSLEEQTIQPKISEFPVQRFKRIRTYRSHPQNETVEPRSDLKFFNGYGGFTPDGREYIITTSGKQMTPAPWVNVLANPNFGSVVSENGPTYTWGENAHEFRLTPWNNDPVCDSGGEAFYIRDEETGHFWSPTPLPCRGIGPYISRHGFGYSVYEHSERGIRSELWIYVSTDEPVKFSVLKVWNESGKPRRLSAIGFLELVLGDLRPKSAMHIITEIDPYSGALLARNSYNSEFSDRIAFFHTSDIDHSFTGDRTEFLGRNGTLANPAAMTRSHLSGKTGAAFDPCAAIQIPFDLDAGQEREIIFKLGVGRNKTEVRKLVLQFEGSNAARNALELVWNYWSHTLGAVQVETPDPSLNILTNGWLMYQTIACRIWARSGYYQSGGAFGFRDQLQDVMALIHTKPDLVRKHILLCASRQFLEGDVQHWWHPPAGRGVRTHCSDDYLWLPSVTCRYVICTGDSGILDEHVKFLEGRSVDLEEDSYYDLPNRSEKTDTLYQHCVRAIIKGLNFGEHGLPLIGSGDWNDGMNLVGIQGKGESVWLGFFLYDVLTKFIKVAEIQNDKLLIDLLQKEAAALQQNIEKNGWDGEWYRRAYFDDGTPLGSAINTECKIDSVVQSWSVISGAGDAKRSQLAMAALDKFLVRRDNGLIQLLDPPFDKSDLNPGYIKGYVPGVRENGGQYTHAAIWAAMAYADLGDSKHAWELLKIINPVNHSDSQQGIDKYKVEPYVVAADVYALAPHIGRGGWTWYTGSAGLMYRLIVESLLGLRLDVDKLYIEPCLPSDWQSYKILYRFRNTIYHITIIQQHISDSGGLDVNKNNNFITLVDDHQEHSIELKIINRSTPG